MTKNYDVIIIGGGIIGNSVAAHLANENLKIGVINSDNLGKSASNAAAGLLTPFQLHEFENSQMKDFCFKSFEYFQSFYEMIGSDFTSSKIDLGFKQLGSLYLIFSYLEVGQKENEIKELKDINPRVSFLNKQDIAKHEPLLTKEALCAFHFPNEAIINNPKFLKAISSYCIKRNVTYINTEVTEIIINNNNVEKIILSTGEDLSAKKYVLCNGAWANKLLKGIFNKKENMIKGIKGEILQIGPIQKLPMKKIIFCKDGYILPRQATNQFEESSILIGSTSTEVDLEENKDIFKNTISGISSLVNLFQQLLPSCKNYPILNLWSGIRPQTKDKLPIIGQCAEIENIYFGLGHYRNGILMGPLTGKILKSLIMEETLEYNIDSFKIDRLIKDNGNTGTTSIITKSSHTLMTKR